MKAKILRDTTPDGLVEKINRELKTQRHHFYSKYAPSIKRR